MRRLVLLRHAKAVRPDEADGDFERGLASRGRDDAQDVGRRLAALGFGTPGLEVLVSTAARTSQTWRILAPLLPPAHVTHLERLYLAEPAVLDEAIDLALARSEADVLIVGHNPGLRDYAAALALRPGRHAPAARARLAQGLPTAWFARFEIEAASDAAPRLAEVDGPPRAID